MLDLKKFIYSMIPFIMIIIIVLTPSLANGEDIIRVYVNGKMIDFYDDVAPRIYQDRVYLPVRKIAECFDMDIIWNAKAETVTFYKKGQIIDHKLFSDEIFINGVPKIFDMKSININGRTLMPIRMLSEAIGAEIDWNTENRAVYINEIKDNVEIINEITVDYTEKNTMPKIISVFINKYFVNKGDTVKIGVIAQDATQVKLIDVENNEEIEIIDIYGIDQNGNHTFEAFLTADSDKEGLSFANVRIMIGNDNSFYENLSDTRTVCYGVYNE